MPLPGPRPFWPYRSQQQWVEDIQYVDQPAGQVLLRGADGEALGFADAPAGQLLLKGSRVEGLLFADGPAGQIVLRGSAGDTKLYVDAVSGQIRLLGSSAEALLFAERPAGKIVLQGSVQENYVPPPIVYTDMMAGLLLLRGTITTTEFQAQVQQPGFFKDQGWGRQDHGLNIW